MSTSQPQSPGESLRERRLHADLEASGQLGRPLYLHATPFKVEAEATANAIMIGPRRYMTRLRRIEDSVEALLAQAEDAWRGLADHHAAEPERFAAAWRAWVTRVDAVTVDLNRLIDAHNRYYPIEANLPMDIHTGDYVTFDRRDFRRPLVTPAWLLDHFPADLAAAQAAAQG